VYLYLSCIFLLEIRAGSSICQRGSRPWQAWAYNGGQRGAQPWWRIIQRMAKS